MDLTLDVSTFVMGGFFIGAAVCTYRLLGLNLSVTSVLVWMMLLLHGPAYLYYTRVWGPQTEFFETILSAAPDADVIGTLDLALALTFISMAIGILSADVLFQRSPRAMQSAIKQWHAKEIVAPPDISGRLYSLAILCVAFVLVPFAVIDHQVPKVVQYFTSNLGEFAKIEMRRQLGGSSVYLYNLALANFLPFLSFCVVVLAARTATRRYVAIAIVLVAMVSLAKAATLSKAPVAIFLLQLALVIYMQNSLQFSRRTAILLSGVALLLFSAMVTVAIPELSGGADVLEFLFYRVLMISNESLLEYFAAIPYLIPHNWGAKFGWLASATQTSPEIPTYWLVGEAHRGVWGSTTTAMFLGDAWADFAWLGVITIAYICGLIVRLIDIDLIIRRGKSIGTIAGVAVAHFGVFTALTTSLQTALLTGGLALVVPFVILADCSVGSIRQALMGKKKLIQEPASSGAELQDGRVL